jgi:hypothetical protein
VIKKIFKSSLESDILMDIVTVFTTELNASTARLLDMAEFLKSTSECWPFEIAVEFLSDKERQQVKNLLDLFEKHGEECKT